jgi:PGF-CTERM protein
MLTSPAVNRDIALTLGIVAVILVIGLGVTLVPGAIDPPDRDEHVRRGHLELTEMTIAAGEVTGNTATLEVTNYLTHHGGPVQNATLFVRVIDTDTEFVETTTRRSLGNISNGDEREQEFAETTNLTVERQGGYRIETIIYQDGERVESGNREVSGVGTLRPAYAESDVKFHDFEGAGSSIPVVGYTIEAVDGDRVRLNVSSYLTNTGTELSDDVTLSVTARQAESNIGADSATVSVAQIRPGRTATPSVTLTVQDNYNYYLDAILKKDGVIVGTASSAAQLDPTETIEQNVTRRSVGIETGDFEQGTSGPRASDLDSDGSAGGDRPRDAQPVETTVTGGSGPGFGFVIAILAVTGAALIGYRRQQP